MTANSGSTAAWFDCTHPAPPTLVVYDTSSGTRWRDRPAAFCKDGCELVDVTGESRLLQPGCLHGRPAAGLQVRPDDRPTRPSTTQEYAEDLRSHPRGLVLGDDWQTGTPITGVGRSPAEDGPLRFDVTGSRLVPQVTVNDRYRATSAFDTATRRALRLRLPSGYNVETTADFHVFEWLDDDTVALRGGPDGQEAKGTDDLLTCRLSSGRCVMSVPSPEADTWRILPEVPLPG